MKQHTCNSALSYSQIINAYGDFLESQCYSHFVTITTRYSLTLKSARNLAERFGNQLNYDGIVAEMFWVAESFDTKEGNHIHALVKLIGSNIINPINKIKIAAKNAIGGNHKVDYKNTKIYPYKPKLGANYYIAKYLNRQITDYDIYLPSKIM
jgi:hypothetical protein